MNNNNIRKTVSFTIRFVMMMKILVIAFIIYLLFHPELIGSFFGKLVQAFNTAVK